MKKCHEKNTIEDRKNGKKSGSTGPKQARPPQGRRAKDRRGFSGGKTTCNSDAFARRARQIIDREVLRLLTIFCRAILLYCFSVAAMRVMGKRQIGQLQPYELVSAILIADLVSEPMSGAETPLLYGIVPVLALVLMHSLFGLLGMKSPGFRRLINGSARVLIRDGSIQYDTLRQVCMPISDLMETVRASGILSIGDVETAVLETNGTLSVFPRAEARPASAGEQGISAPEEALPLVLISDGELRRSELDGAGIDEQALLRFLRGQKIARPEQVLLCALDSKGTVFLQLRGKDQKARRVPWKEMSACADA